MSNYELHFYDNETEMLADLRRIAFAKGAGGPWKIAKTLVLTEIQKKTLEELDIKTKDFLVVIKTFNGF